MPAFGTRSEANLAHVDPRLVRVLRDVIRYFDFTVLVGFRGKEAQEEAVASGQSRDHWPNGNHNDPKHPEANPPAGVFVTAVDVAPWPIDWKDERAFCFLAGLISGAARARGLALRWGGDWDGDGGSRDQSLNDLGHLEILD